MPAIGNANNITRRTCGRN